MASGTIKSLPSSTMRTVPFAIAVSDWALTSGHYVATYQSAYVTANSEEIIIFDSSIRMYTSYDIEGEKTSGGGSITFTTDSLPSSTITGSIYVFASSDGKLPVIIEGTTVSIANGGTGATSVAGAQINLGLSPTQDRTKTTSGFVADARVIKEMDGQMKSYTWTPSSGSDTILNYVTAIARNYLPFSFVKQGNVTPSDCPFSSDEFTAFVDGDGDRIKVTIKPYKSTNNNVEYCRDIWQNTWLEQGWDRMNTWRQYQTKTYSKTYTASGSAYVTLTADDFGVSTPSGYVPVAITQFSTGTSVVFPVYINCQATGTTEIMNLKNTSTSSASSKTASLTIFYIQS